MHIFEIEAAMYLIHATHPFVKSDLCVAFLISDRREEHPSDFGHLKGRSSVCALLI